MPVLPVRPIWKVHQQVQARLKTDAEVRQAGRRAEAEGDCVERQFGIPHLCRDRPSMDAVKDFPSDMMHTIENFADHAMSLLKVTLPRALHLSPRLILARPAPCPA